MDSLHHRLLVAVSVVVCFLVGAPAVAQIGTLPADGGAAASVDPFGWGWGGGIGFSDNLDRNLAGPDGAFIDETGTVRITRLQNVKPRVLLENHFTWGVGGQVALGPVMFVQPGSDGLFDAAGAGLILELGSGPTSFNIILGALVDFKVTSLHPDFVDGQPAPGPDLIHVTKEEVQAFFGFAIGR